MAGLGGASLEIALFGRKLLSWKSGNHETKTSIASSLVIRPFRNLPKYPGQTA